MKNGFKRVSFRVLSTLLCLLILLSTMSVGFVMTANGAADSHAFFKGDTLYLDAQNWGWGDARFAAFFCHNSDDKADKWVSMSGNNNIRTVTVPDDGYYTVIFCRMKKSNSTNNWENVYNQTTDLKFTQQGYNKFIIEGYSYGKWEYYNDCDSVSIRHNINGGDFDSSSEFKLLTKSSDGKTFSGSFEIPAGKYKFKVLEDNITWYGNDGTFTDTASGWTMSVFAGDTIFTATGGLYTFSYNVTTHKLTVSRQSENQEPTINVTTTNNVASYQTVTLNFSDNSGIKSYTWNSTVTNTTSNSATITVSSKGTYTATVTDTYGNVSDPVSITFSETILNTNGGTVTPSTIITKKGNIISTLPKPTKKGYSFVGWSESADSNTVINNSNIDVDYDSKTYYAVWEKGGYALAGKINGATVSSPTNIFDKNGELELTLTHSSQVYVMVDTGDLNYKFSSQCDDTSGILSTTGTSTMFVPAGNIKFKLVENADGTLTLSYKVLSLSDNDESSGYYLKGTFNDWNRNNQNINKFKYISSDTLSTSLFLTAGYYDFKINDVNGDDPKSQNTGDWLIFSNNSTVNDTTNGALAMKPYLDSNTNANLNASGGIYTFIYDHNVRNNTTNDLSDDTLKIEYSPDFKFYYAVPESVVKGASVVSQIKFAGLEESETIMTKTNKTYEGMPIYEITFTKGTYNGSLDLLNFNIIDYNKGEVWYSQEQAISSSTDVATINGKMFVYTEDPDDVSEIPADLVDYTSDTVLPAPKFVINDGVDTVSSRENIIIDFTDSISGFEIPNNTILTVNVGGKDYNVDIVNGTYTLTLNKGTLDEGDYTVSATIASSTTGYGSKTETATLKVTNAGLAPYYLIGNNIEKDSKVCDTHDSRLYPFEETGSNTGVYHVVVPYSAIGGVGTEFRLTDGFTYYAPASDAKIDIDEEVVTYPDENGDRAYTALSDIIADGSGHFTNGEGGKKDEDQPFTQTWDHVNVYYDTNDNRIYLTQVDDYYTTSKDVNVTLKAGNTNDKVASVVYNGSTTLTATFNGSFIPVNDPNSTYTGSLVYQFYKMKGSEIDLEKDELLGNVKTADKTAKIQVNNITEYSKYYVLVSPATNTTVRVPSAVEVVSIAQEFRQKDITIYVDCEKITPSAVSVRTVDVKSPDSKSVEMTVTNNPNIFKVTVPMNYTVDKYNEITSALTVQSFDVTVGGNETTVYVSISQQPDIKKVVETGEIWFYFNDSLKSQATTTVGGKTKYEMLDGYTTEADAPGITVTNVPYEYRTIYCSDGFEYKGWGSMSISYYDNGQWSNWFDMTKVGKNNQATPQDIYKYAQVPITATQVKFAKNSNGDSSTDPAVIKQDVDYNTHNAYYIETYKKDNDPNKFEAIVWPTDFNPASPIVLTYTDTVNLSIVGTGVNKKVDSYNITPIDYYDTLVYTIKSGSEFIDFDPETGIVTAKAVGTATIEILPYAVIEGGIQQNSGDPVTITINVVDKTDIAKLIYNAELIINSKVEVNKFEAVSYANLVTAYENALDAYRNEFKSTDDGKLDTTATKALEDALNGLVYLKYAEESSKVVELISYKSATATLTAENAKTANTISNVDSNGIVNAVKENDIVSYYTVKYAADDGTSPNVIKFTLSANAAATSGDTANTAFVEWTQDNNSLGSSLNITKALYGDSTIIAEYKPADPVNVVIRYNYDVYNIDGEGGSGSYEYMDGYTLPATYETAEISMDSSWLSNGTISEEAKSIVKKYTPVIVSSYYDYNLSEKPAKCTEESEKKYIIDAYLDKTVQMYTVFVNGKKHTDDDHPDGLYHFQEMITIDSSLYTNEAEVYWFNKETPGQPISVKKGYQLRVTENMNLGVEAKDDNSIIDSSVVTPAFAELDGNNKFHQNFFIQHFFDADADNDGENEKTFVGGGVFYYTFNDNTGKPSSSKIPYNASNPNADIENLKLYAKALAQTDITSGDTLSGSSYVYTNPTTGVQKNTGYVYSYTSYDKNIHKADGTEKNITDPSRLFRYSTANGAYNYFYDKYITYDSTKAKYSYHLYSYYVYEEAGEYKVVISADFASAKCYLTTTEIANQ